jgi:hypothetical protein
MDDDLAFIFLLRQEFVMCTQLLVPVFGAEEVVRVLGAEFN